MTTTSIAIVDGVRTPFVKAGGVFGGVSADDLGVIVVRELLTRNGIRPTEVDEVIFGNVAQPVHAANIARVIAVRAGLPDRVVAHTVHHNCASGMRALTAAALSIQTGRADLVVAGGTESMSQIPLLVSAPMTALFMRLMRAKSLARRLRTLASLRPGHLKPIIALQLGLTDPTCGLNMGQTAEILARDFGVTRRDQDEFALESHRKAIAALDAKRMADEITPVIVPPRFREVQHDDDGPRRGQTVEALEKLRPYFDRHAGTVTVGNACPITDGAAAVIMMSDRKARSLGLKPLGRLDGWAYAGLEGRRMGLGPAFATARLLDQTSTAMSDFDVVELNEAFAAQVVANERAFESKTFAEKELGRSTPLGAIDRSRLNVNGGAIALGHPVGATGTRLVVTLLRELARRGGGRGLATLCVGGGQGAALAVEAAS